MVHFSFRLLLAPLLFASTSAYSELVLNGHGLSRVYVDTSPFDGQDGLVIHEGDHIHDPCLTFTGERFTLVGSGENSARGFIVVNDCHVVECTRWTTPSNKTGGETVVYQLTPKSDQTTVWKVQEAGKCTCDGWSSSSTCYVGKFLHMAGEYDKDCSVVGSPGSIPCDDKASMFTISTRVVWDTAEKAGISLIAIFGAILAGLVAYCLCCFRKKKNNTSRSAAAASSGEKNKRFGWFAATNKNSSSSKSPTTSDEDSVKIQPEKNKKSGWFGRKSASDEPNMKANAIQGPILDLDDGKDVENGGLFFAANKGRSMNSSDKKQKSGWFKSKKSIDESTLQDVTASPDSPKSAKRGWFASKAKDQTSSTKITVVNTNDEQDAQQTRRGGWFFNKKRQEPSPPVEVEQATPLPEKNGRKWQFLGRSCNDDNTADGLPKAEKKENNESNTKENKKGDKSESKSKEEEEGVDCTCCGI